MVTLHRVTSKTTGEEREIHVYLPPDYDIDDGPYPVLYMQDGQNVFEPPPAGWGLAETMDGLVDDESVAPVVVVGIANSMWRDDEYTPCRDEEEDAGGFADHYLDYLEADVLPFVEETYAVATEREGRAIGGSSLGGLLALYAVMARPESFSRAAILSPSLWWSERCIFELVEAWDDDPEAFRLWMDMGYWEHDAEDEAAGEPHPIEDTDALHELLIDKGFSPDDNLMYATDEEGSHDEVSWGKRMELVIPFLFGD